MAIYSPIQNPDSLKKQWHLSQRLADQFWTRCMKEVLPHLNKRQTWHKRKENLKVGDVVIMMDEKNPRNHWPKGVVTKTFPGKDHLVRVAEIRTAKGIYGRPVVKLCKILDGGGRMFRNGT